MKSYTEALKKIPNFDEKFKSQFIPKLRGILLDKGYDAVVFPHEVVALNTDIIEIEGQEKKPKPKPEKEEVSDSQFEKDYQVIKNYFLTFDQKKKKIGDLLNKANEHIVAMGSSLIKKMGNNEISHDEYMQMSKVYSDRLNKILLESKKYHGDKFNTIVRVLSQKNATLNDLPNYSWSYGESVGKLYTKGDKNNNKHWPSERLDNALKGFASITGDLAKGVDTKKDAVFDMWEKLNGDSAKTYKEQAKGWNPLLIKIKGKVRAYCRWNKTHARVVIGNNSNETTLMHELGHYLEDTNPELKEKAIAYVQERTKNDKLITLAEATGNKSYSNIEKCKPDKFIEPYTGKMYFQNPKDTTMPTNTELISMWFTHVFQNPTKFIQNDEDHFKTVLRWMREK